MSTARQVIRWAVPGYLLFLFLGVFALIRWTFVHGASTFDLSAFMAWQDHPFFAENILPQLVVFVAGAGVPLGFLIYQFYFIGYWRGLGFFRTKPEDKGWAILQGLDIDWERVFGGAVAQPEEYRGEPSILRSSAAARQLLHNWHLAQSLLCALCDTTAASNIRENVQYLTDVYHGVGTTRMSLMIAFALYLGVVSISDLPTILGSEPVMPMLQALVEMCLPWKGSSVLHASGAWWATVTSPLAWATGTNLIVFLTIRHVLSLTRRQVLEDLISAQRLHLAAVFGASDE